MRYLRQPLARDAGLALLLAVASLLLGARTFTLFADDQKKMIVSGLSEAWHAHVLLWWVAAVPAIVALLIRRRWPWPAFLLAALSAGVHQLQPGLLQLPLDLAVVVAMYTLASAVPRRVSVPALAGALVALYLLCSASLSGGLRVGPPMRQRPLPVAGTPWAPESLVEAFYTAAVPALLLGIGWAVGDNARTRRLYLASLEQRAADLQRERDQRAALAVAAERARITRELHDVVAHGVSVMVVQAQAAAAAQRRHPDVTAEALTNVIDTGRASLAEMRRVLGSGPQPGVAALPALIEQVRGAGTPVLLHIEGSPGPLPSVVDLSAYRIVQEALTNTRKHAGAGARATVRLVFSPTRLEVSVADDGIGASNGSPAAGNGMRGIEERVGALGGTLTAGPCADGGFGIHALLPIPAST
jgi:signal transduction histidine kinase